MLGVYLKAEFLTFLHPHRGKPQHRHDTPPPFFDSHLRQPHAVVFSLLALARGTHDSKVERRVEHNGPIESAVVVRDAAAAVGRLWPLL